MMRQALGNDETRFSSFSFRRIGKLQSRSYKIAYALLNKLSKPSAEQPPLAGNSGSSVKPGDR